MRWDSHIVAPFSAVVATQGVMGRTWSLPLCLCVFEAFIENLKNRLGTRQVARANSCKLFSYDCKLANKGPKQITHGCSRLSLNCSVSTPQNLHAVLYLHSVTNSLIIFSGNLTGQYYPLNGMTAAEQQQLIDDHFLFDKPVSPLLTCAGMARDWPDARGIWHNNDKNFLVWINEEDHTRVISMEKGGDMRSVFDRFCRGLNEVERLIKRQGHEFMWNQHLGYILTCPSNLGTGLRAGVHVKLPHLAKVNTWTMIFLAGNRSYIVVFAPSLVLRVSRSSLASRLRSLACKTRKTNGLLCFQQAWTSKACTSAWARHFIAKILIAQEDQRLLFYHTITTLNISILQDSRFGDILDKLRLQKRGTGEHSYRSSTELYSLLTLLLLLTNCESSRSKSIVFFI